MRMKFEPGSLSGRVSAITSKSAAHRSLICAALADRESELRISDRSEDVDATINCLKSMGAKIVTDGELSRVTPLAGGKKNVTLHCGESGSTLRFLLPVAASVCESVRFTGAGRLPHRPLYQLIEVMREKGSQIETQASDGLLPLIVSGRLKSGVYPIAGDVSSQYVSGLLLTLPLLDGDSRIELTSPMESTAYVDMTIDALRQFSAAVEKQYNQGTLSGFFVSGGQRYRTQGAVNVEGDWSNAAFFLTAGALGAEKICCTGLNMSSLQGDKAVIQILKNMGARTAITEKGIVVTAGKLRGIEIDVSQIPDLMPVLAVAACAAAGKTIFKNAKRLRMKESDRIASTAALINGLGGWAEEGTDCLTVVGTGGLKGGEAHSFGDHRIAMSAAVAALICREPVLLEGAEAVKKSYPHFYENYKRLGGKAHVI